MFQPAAFGTFAAQQADHGQSNRQGEEFKQMPKEMRKRYERREAKASNHTMQAMTPQGQPPWAPPGTFADQQQQDNARFYQQYNALPQNPLAGAGYMMPPFFPNPYDQSAMPQGYDRWNYPDPQSSFTTGKPYKAAAAKQSTGALRSDEVRQLKRAVKEKMKSQPKPATAEAKEDFRRGSPQAVPPSASSGAADPDSLKDNVDYERVDTALADLDSGDELKRQAALQWVSESFWSLSLSKKGCRVVQKAMDVATPAYHLQLLENLRSCVKDCAESPHANYVLQKFIEMAPPEQIQFVVEEVQDNVLYIARHQFGCRILQRLLENCKLWQTENLINQVLTHAAPLCRHQYGNFILQHILQYGSPRHRTAMADVILADIIRLSKHRLASHIVSCALVNCAPEDVQRLVNAVLCDESQLYNLSRREYGSFVVREVYRAARLINGEDIASPKKKYEDGNKVATIYEDGNDEANPEKMAQELERQHTAGMSRQCTSDKMERQTTLGAYMDAMAMERQTTAGAYMD